MPATPRSATIGDANDATDATYGADANGLICGFRFAVGAPAVPIDSVRAVRWLADAPPAGEFLWLHLSLSHAASLGWLRAHAAFDDAFYEALADGSRSTRIERLGDSIFAVLNDVTYDFAFEASDVASLWVNARAQLVISARRRPLRSVDRLRIAVKRGESMASAAALLDHLLRDQADELQHIVRQAGERVDDIEDALLVGRTERLGAELAQLRRMSVRLQRLLAPEPNAFFRMLASPPAWLADDDRQRLRQANEEFAVVVRDIGALQERIKLLQEESAARVAEQNNRTLFILTMVTVLALPINLVSGLLGMNVGGVPFNQHTHGFWWVLVLILFLTIAMARVALRRLGPRG